MTYSVEEVLSKDIREEFNTIDEEGKWNFYLKPAMNIKGEFLGFYEIMLGNKFFRSYNSTEDCIKAIQRNFIQDRKGNGLIAEDEYNIIEVKISQ